MYHLLLLLLFVCHLTQSQDISPLVDVKTLSELPIDKLLQVKKTFDLEGNDLDKPDTNSSIDGLDIEPQALALQIKKKPNDRGGFSFGDDDYSKKGKKSIQSIFQISVTTLAFLAFGGYLLCLLSQAIKGKQDMMTTVTNPTIMAAFLRPTVRRRTTRRPIRLQQRPYNTRRRRPRPRPRTKRDVWSETDPEVLYSTLINLSEAYTQYHTMDYKFFNSSTFMGL